MTFHSGIIRILRRLQEGGGNLPLRALGGAAVAPVLHQLRDLYGMVREDTAGWHLTHTPQWLHLPAEMPLPVHCCDEVPSTQYAIEHLDAPCALFAEHQTAGIGQRGRGWFGLPADALAVSLRLPAPAQPGGLSVALGAMLCAALSPQLRFKWPNDILTPQGHKVAGILTQIKGDNLLIGIGANWQMTPPLHRYIAAHGTTPAALAECTSLRSRNDCAATLVRTAVQTVAAYEEGFAPFRTIAEAVHIAPLGTALHIDGAARTFLGFAEDGALLTHGVPMHNVAGG